MPTTTDNYPKQESEWFGFIHRGDRPAIVDWMKSRPAFPSDNAVHRLARWTYCVTDHGVATSVVVRDNLDGTEFAVPVNIEDI
jgi:hypothetical protein